MGVLAVTFRIAEDESAADYNKRYKAITDKIKTYASGTAWEETTSFYLFNSASSASTVAHGVFMLTEFRSSKETILVINTSDTKDHKHYGAKYPNTLDGILGKR